MRARKLWRRFREDETVLVRSPRAERGLMIHGALTFVGGFVAIAVVGSDNTLVHAVASATLGGIVGWQGLGRLRRARSYWSGWLNGRLMMVESLGEARRRDMDLQEWLNAEIARDLAVIGGEGHDKDDPRG